jgi:Na+/H+ antiporter NhaD/arsenite permease-like protein
VDYRTTVTLVVFVLTYAGIATGHVWGLKLDRTGIVLLGGIALLALDCVTLNQAVQFINYPSILMLFGFFVLSAQLRMSGFYDWAAQSIAKSLDRPARFLLILMLSSGVLSAFLNNDIVCFAFAPVVTVTLLQQQLNPIPFLVALAISSNIGCAATLIGNAQDILVGQMARLSFGHYLFWALPPVIASMTAAFGIIWWIAHQHLHVSEPPPVRADLAPIPFNRRHTIKGLIILALVVHPSEGEG